MCAFFPAVLWKNTQTAIAVSSQPCKRGFGLVLLCWTVFFHRMLPIPQLPSSLIALGNETPFPILFYQNDLSGNSRIPAQSTSVLMGCFPQNKMQLLTTSMLCWNCRVWDTSPSPWRGHFTGEPLLKPRSGLFFLPGSWERTPDPCAGIFSSSAAPGRSYCILLALRTVPCYLSRVTLQWGTCGFSAGSQYSWKSRQDLGEVKIIISICHVFLYLCSVHTSNNSCSDPIFGWCQPLVALKPRCSWCYSKSLSSPGACHMECPLPELTREPTDNSQKTLNIQMLQKPMSWTPSNIPGCRVVPL